MKTVVCCNVIEKDSQFTLIPMVSFLAFVLRPRLSFVIALLDFNASPNDIAPVSPISLTVDVKKKKK